MGLIDFPPDMFRLNEGEPAIYGHDPDVKTFADYLIKCLGQEAWEKRRYDAALHFYKSLVNEGPNPNGKGRFFAEDDQIAWYLFLAESFNDHPQNYEIIFGSRVVPIFKSLGKNIDNILRIGGLEKRIQRMMNSEKAQPNGGLFELLVGAAYVREGFRVEFIDEDKKGRKTPDMYVSRGAMRFVVECKRMEGGDYHEMERMRMRHLWSRPNDIIQQHGKSVFMAANFKCEIDNVPEHYLLKKVMEYLHGHRSHAEFDDEVATGSILPLDLSEIQAHLKDNLILHPSSQYLKLLLGSYLRYDNLLTSQKVKFAGNPHFIEEMEMAIVLRWSSLSDEAVRKKARDIMRQISQANDQFPGDMPGVIHVGYETLGGDVIERRRYEKIKETLSRFDPKGKPLASIFCHSFSPEAPPDETWAYDETCHFHNYGLMPLPLSELSLVVPGSVPLRDGTHWDGAS